MRPCKPAAKPRAVPPIVKPRDKPAVTGANITPAEGCHKVKCHHLYS